MAYSKEIEKRLTDLLNETEGRKEHECAAATYKDVPALKEIVRLVEEQLALDSDESTYVDSIAVLGYIADRYDSLGRFAVSAKFYNQILTLALIDEIEEKVEKSRRAFGHGSCFEVWSLKKSYLLEHDIEWQTPSELNPRVLFD